MPDEKIVDPANPEDREIPEAEKGMVRRLMKQIEARLESPEYKAFTQRNEKNRLYARGEQEDDGEKGLVRANLIHPELKKAQNECYAKNPEITITPTESVNKDRYETWKQTGKTIELVLNHQFAPAQADIKAKAKRAVRASDTTGFGWLKVVYQKHIERDPIVEKRMEDIQDNIQNIDRLMGEIGRFAEVDGVQADHEANKEELEQQIKALEKNVEVVRSQGLVFSVRPSQNVLFSMEVQDVDDIKRSDWITDMIWMKVSKCKALFNFCPKEATRYNERKVEAKEAASKGDNTDDDDMFVRVYEMWRMADKQIYTLVEGYEGYLKEPYPPRKLGERFHGFFPLVFDPVDGSAFPLPLVSQLVELQDEHNTARTNFREHRERSVPFNVAHGGQLDPSDTDKLTNPGFMETVVLKSAPEGQALDAVFKSVQHNPIDPQVYSTDHVRVDWEQITRRGDAGRGVIARSKTATEADILQSNLAVDTSERRDVVEDWFREIAQYSMELILQEMTLPEVERIAGQGAMWPQLSKNEVFDMVSLDVRVGSSGKPNAAQETQRWLEMLPQLRESLIAIADMLEAGKDQQAEILTRLLRETLERFEERIDLDALLPKKEEGPDPAKEAAEEERRMHVALQLKDMISTIANRDADTMKKVAEAEAKEAGPQMQIYMTILQGLLNNQQPSGSVQ